MCGIAAILASGAVDPPPDAIERMTAALAHRGPDARACARLADCHLGHTRLSIVDLAGGAQPMADQTGRFTLVFNGEIYNHGDLRAALESEGERFRTRSDTEVLLLGYRRWGAGVMRRLNGPFAFAVWDAERQMLFAARDRFGERPLYWARTPAGQVVLASEIKSILASALVSPRLDRLSVDAYLGLFYVPPDGTVYENVHVVPPAHTFTIDAEARVSQERYWSPRLSGNDVPFDEAAESIRALLAQAVRRQMSADVPVGAFLSGGLDSSTIVGLMAREAAARVSTFAVGFGDLIDELPFARAVAERHATEHHELQMDIDVAAMLGRMDATYDEPFADSSNIPTYLVAQHARRGVKAVLSGDGGDELFGGYAWYAPLLDPPPRGAPGDVWERHVGGATAALADRSALWGPTRQPPTAQVIREHYRPGGDTRDMDRAVSFDVACYLPGDILTKVDRAAMAHGLETRCPFLDVDLADYVLSLPWQTRFAGGASKALLRRACEDLWPACVRGRGKQGFGAPVRHWLEQAAVARLWERAIRRDGPLAALLPGVRDAAAAGLRPQRKWTLLCLGLWLEGRTECLARLP